MAIYEWFGERRSGAETANTGVERKLEGAGVITVADSVVGERRSGAETANTGVERKLEGAIR